MNGIAKLQILLQLKDKLTGPFNKVHDKLQNLKKPVEAFKKANVDLFNAIEDRVPGVSNILGLIKNPYVLATAAVVGLGVVTAKAVSKAMDYEEGMAKINATALLTKEQLGGVRSELMAIGKESGGNFDRIPEAYEKILSQTGDVKQSLEILKASVMGAKAGFTDLDVVAGAIGQSLSVIGKENASAQEVLDTFTAAKRVGAGEFQDFATYLPTLIAAGDNLGIKFKDVAGLFAYMTGKGQEASQATMLMQNAFTALGKSEIQKGMKKFGINVFDKEGMIRDMGDIMTDMNKLLAGKSDQQKSNILEKMGLRDVQAKNAFSILLSDTDKLKEALKATNNSMGDTKDALDATNNPTRTWKDFLDKISFVMTKLGQKLLPVVTWALNGLNNAFNWVIEHGDIIRTILWWMLLPLKIAIFPIRIFIKAIGYLVEKFLEWWDTATTIRGVLAGLGAVVMWVGSIFYALGKIIDGVFSLSPKKMIEGLSDLQAAGKMSVAQVYKTGRDNFLAGDKNAPEEEKDLLPKGKKKKGVSQTTGVDTVVSGGAQTKSFTINIRSLNEGGINIKTTNLSEGLGDIEKKVFEMLLRVVRNTESLA